MENNHITLSVFSLRGGVGATSLSINLAAAMAQLWGIEPTLWDLALSCGQCAFILNLQPKTNIVSLTDWPDDTPMGDNVIATLLVKNPAGFQLLAAPPSPAEAELVTQALTDRVWSFLRRRSYCTIIDAGSHFNDPVLSMLDRSDRILILLAPELASVKAAHDALQTFESIGLDLEKVTLVQNNVIPEHHLATHKIESALKHKVNAVIPYDHEAFIQTVNGGRPFVFSNSKSEVSQAVYSLAYKLTCEEMEDNPAVRPSAMAGWMKSHR